MNALRDACLGMGWLAVRRWLGGIPLWAGWEKLTESVSVGDAAPDGSERAPEPGAPAGDRGTTGRAGLAQVADRGDVAAGGDAAQLPGGRPGSDRSAALFALPFAAARVPGGQDVNAMSASLSQTGEERLRRLVEVGRTLVAELDLEVVLRRVLEAARGLTGAEYAALGVLNERRDALERFLTAGIDEATHRTIGDLPRGHGVLGVLIEEPRPLRLASVGAHPRSYGFPPGHPHMQTFLGVPIVVRGEAFGNLYLAEKTGGEFSEEDEEALVVLADWAAIAIANARVHARVEARRDELERAVAGLEASTEIARALAGEKDLDHVLELVVKRGRALTEARAMIVLLERWSELEVVAIAGELDQALLGERVPIDESVSGAVFRSGKTERLRERSRLRFALAEQTSANTGLFVPLRFHGRVLGILAGFDRLREGPEFSARDESLLSSFAVSAAAAVANAQDLATQARRRSIAAAEQERARWARELHDETLQELAVLKLLLAPVRRLEDPREREAALEQVTTRIDTAVRALRSLITDLRPAALHDYDLKSALEALADRAARDGQLTVDLRVELAYESGHELPRLAPQIEDTLYRVVQEALSNVVKHAGATRAEVVVLEDDGIVEAVVHDDGRGFDPEQKSTGFGVMGMQERAALIDGTITIEPSPETGTLVRLAAPALRAGQSSLRTVSAQHGS